MYDGRMNELTGEILEITIDGEKIPVKLEGMKTFGDLLSHVESQVILFPRVLTRIFLNEDEIDEGQEVGLGGFTLDGVASLEIETANRIDLAHEALEDAQNYLPELSEILEPAARTIREGNVNDGVMAASQALEYISAFGQILDGLRSTFQIDFAQVKIDDYTLLDKLLELNAFAGKILKAVETQDWTLFADMLEYEISPLLYQWMAVVPELVKILPSPEPEADE